MEDERDAERDADIRGGMVVIVEKKRFLGDEWSFRVESFDVAVGDESEWVYKDNICEVEMRTGVTVRGKWVARSRKGCGGQVYGVMWQGWMKVKICRKCVDRVNVLMNLDVGEAVEDGGVGLAAERLEMSVRELNEMWTGNGIESPGRAGRAGRAGRGKCGKGRLGGRLGGKGAGGAGGAGFLSFMGWLTNGGDKVRGDWEESVEEVMAWMKMCLKAELWSEMRLKMLEMKEDVSVILSDGF